VAVKGLRGQRRKANVCAAGVSAMCTKSDKGNQSMRCWCERCVQEDRGGKSAS
jgi:hypothetical protein